MIRAVLRIIGGVIGGIVGLAVLLYAIAVAINWNDEPPSVAARRFTELYGSMPAVADADNAYVYMMGMHAPSGENPIDAGIRRLAVLRASRDWRTDPAPNSSNMYPLAVQEFRSACTDDEPQCIAAFADATPVLDEWTASDPELFPRYQVLLTYDAWRDEFPNDVSLPLPSYTEVLDGQRLLLLHAYSLAEQGRGGEIAELLGRDLRFWRNVLESTDLLITKMIALVALRHNFEWGNLVYRRLGAGEFNAAVPGPWLVAFTDAELSMLRTMTGEWLYVSSTMVEGSVLELDDGLSPPPWTDRVLDPLLLPLYQPQDTANRFAEHYWALSQEFAVPLPALPQALERANELTDQVTGSAFEHRFYNPIGNVFLASISDFGSYAARVADIEGVRRAAMAAVTLRARGIEGVDVQTALDGSDWTSPYDGTPLRWNATDRAIVFRGLEPGDRGEHRVYY